LLAKRHQVVKRVQLEAKRRGLRFETRELTNHQAIIVDGLRSTLGHHGEIAETVAHSFRDQFADKFGKGWWR
jgi:hypothetical protein